MRYSRAARGRVRVRKTWRSANLRDVQTAAGKTLLLRSSLTLCLFRVPRRNWIIESSRDTNRVAAGKTRRGGWWANEGICNNRRTRAESLATFSRRIDEYLWTKLFFPTPPRNWRSWASRFTFPYLAPRFIVRADRARRYLRIEQPQLTLNARCELGV